MNPLVQVDRYQPHTVRDDRASFSRIAYQPLPPPRPSRPGNGASGSYGTGAEWKATSSAERQARHPIGVRQQGSSMRLAAKMPSCTLATAARLRHLRLPPVSRSSPVGGMPKTPTIPPMAGEPHLRVSHTPWQVWQHTRPPASRRAPKPITPGPAPAASSTHTADFGASAISCRRVSRPCAVSSVVSSAWPTSSVRNSRPLAPTAH